jgi:hypothetical protein
MSPEKYLEAFLVQRLNSLLPSLQTVGANQIEVDAVLPRMVVACTAANDDAGLARAGVFAVSVEVAILFDALAGDPEPTMNPLAYQVNEVLAEWEFLRNEYLLVCGGNFVSAETQNDEERITRTINWTLWATFLN